MWSSLMVPGYLSEETVPARGTRSRPSARYVRAPKGVRLTGHGFVTGRPLLYHNHGIQVAQGPAIMVAGEPITVQVMHLGASPLRLTTDMTVGFIDPYEGPTYEVPRDKIPECDETSKEEKDSPLPGVDVSSVPEEWSGDLRAPLQKHTPLWGGNLGLIRGVELRMRLKPGAVPVRQHPYKAVPLAREREKAEVERMRSMGVIEPSTGEWASPGVMVPKPDGSVGFCIDYRKLNLMKVKDAYPIPRMYECIDSIEDARAFSTLDCNAGYWQIPVAEEDKDLTAFTCHSGAWQCVRLPFGL